MCAAILVDAARRAIRERADARIREAHDAAHTGDLDD
jgi:hypothetical protein